MGGDWGEPLRARGPSSRKRTFGGTPAGGHLMWERRVMITPLWGVRRKGGREVGGKSGERWRDTRVERRVAKRSERRPGDEGGSGEGPINEVPVEGG